MQVGGRMWTWWTWCDRVSLSFCPERNTLVMRLRSTVNLLVTTMMVLLDFPNCEFTFTPSWYRYRFCIGPVRSNDQGCWGRLCRRFILVCRDITSDEVTSCYHVGLKDSCLKCPVFPTHRLYVGRRFRYSYSSPSILVTQFSIFTSHNCVTNV